RHRVLLPDRPLRVKDFRSYEKTLEKAGVIVDPAKRQATIVSQMDRIAKQKNGLLHADEVLLEQAVFSVEIPQAIIGSFDSRYLDLPKAVLMTALKEHQGHFSALRQNGDLLRP